MDGEAHTRAAPGMRSAGPPRRQPPLPPHPPAEKAAVPPPRLQPSSSFCRCRCCCCWKYFPISSSERGTLKGRAGCGPTPGRPARPALPCPALPGAAPSPALLAPSPASSRSHSPGCPAACRSKPDPICTLQSKGAAGIALHPPPPHRGFLYHWVREPWEGWKDRQRGARSTLLCMSQSPLLLSGGREARGVPRGPGLRFTPSITSPVP